MDFLIEDEKHMATRNKAIVVEQKLRPEQTKQDPFLTMAVFQYLIGNTDWSCTILAKYKIAEDRFFHAINYSALRF
jgi:hypothetical protein